MASAAAVASSSNEAFQRQPRQIGDHRLEGQQGLEPSLRDFSLIRRVLGVPSGIFQNVSLNHGRGHTVVIPHADERAEDLVSLGERAQFGHRFVFRPVPAEGQRPLHPDIRGHRRVYERIEGLQSDGRQHFLDVGVRRSDMPLHKRIGGLGKRSGLRGLHARLLR